ncbi:hypothetical protein PH210_25695 [Paenibacillus sp. BSR1-1]|uniref:hypothetical protein n=1 Tax=Paenibacillus sp. BSR1-1 TaxID=3020845 RepID=UPI0025B18FA2|nr:hypothetical protein [Paenibacillus sp. BSR1-1]MDN3019562.1 hypothetical protein [Paenibacillus sp. BSR1-1]
MTTIPLTFFKGYVDFETLLIGAEGAKTPAGVRGRGDPGGAKAPRRLPGTPAESKAPGAQINNQVQQSKKIKQQREGKEHGWRK